MKAQIEIDVDSIIDSLSTNECVELAKKLINDFLDVSQTVDSLFDSGYTQDDICDEISDGAMIDCLKKRGYEVKMI